MKLFCSFKTALFKTQIWIQSQKKIFFVENLRFWELLRHEIYRGIPQPLFRDDQKTNIGKCRTLIRKIKYRKWFQTGRFSSIACPFKSFDLIWKNTEIYMTLCFGCPLKRVVGLKCYKSARNLIEGLIDVNVIAKCQQIASFSKLDWFLHQWITFYAVYNSEKFIRSVSIVRRQRSF